MTKTILARLLGLLLAASSPAFAQSPAPGPTASRAAYTGPRFPGGPDSLRAFVYRAVRQASTVPAGKMVVRFELKDGWKPQNFELLTPPIAASTELQQAAATALIYLQARMPAWLPDASDPEELTFGPMPKISLVLDFRPGPAARPYTYADQVPMFPDLEASLRGQRVKANKMTIDYGSKSIIRSIQKQSRYPAEDLRQNRQGVVYGYFEVAENGALENREILGTVSPTLDAEVLSILNRLPAATTPAQLQGQPVRVYYVLPITFKIM